MAQFDFTMNSGHAYPKQTAAEIHVYSTSSNICVPEWAGYIPNQPHYGELQYSYLIYMQGASLINAILTSIVS